MPDQHLYESHAIVAVVIVDYYYSASWCLVDFFEKLLAWLGIEPTTLDLGPRSGTFDLSTIKIFKERSVRFW